MKKTIMITLLCFLTACNAGNGEGLNTQGQPIPQQPETEQPDVNTPPDEPTVPEPPVIDPIEEQGIQPTLSSIQENVFTPICSTCHGGANPAAGQNLSNIENSIANLINVNSSNPQFKRVLPGSSDESYLYLKVTGNSQAGAQMPLGQRALDQDTINAIKQWIDDGALIPEQSQAVPRINQVSTSKTQVPAATNTQVINVMFNKSMNIATLNVDEILITASKSSNDALSNEQENTWLLPNDNIAINAVNDHQLHITLKDLDSDITHITVQLNQSNLSTITSTSGQELDGDSDGFTGGAFTYEISL